MLGVHAVYKKAQRVPLKKKFGNCWFKSYCFCRSWHFSQRKKLYSKYLLCVRMWCGYTVLY